MADITPVEIPVFDHQGNWLGTASCFGDAREMQKNALPEHLRKAYAGIGQHGQCQFYAEHLTESDLKEIGNK